MTRRQDSAAASWAAALAPISDGIAIAEMMPIIVTTISSSIREKPLWELREYITFNKAIEVCRILTEVEARFSFGTLSRRERGFASVTVDLTKLCGRRTERRTDYTFGRQSFATPLFQVERFEELCREIRQPSPRSHARFPWGKLTMTRG